MRRRRGDLPTSNAGGGGGDGGGSGDDDDDPTASVVVVREDGGRNDAGKTAATRGLVRVRTVPFVLTQGKFRDFIRDERARTRRNDEDVARKCERNE